MARRDELIIGDTWVGEVVVLGDDGPVDLTGATVVVQLRRASDALLVEPAVEVIDAPGGLLRWTVPAELTASYEAGQLDYGVRVTVGGVVSTVLRDHLRVVRGPVRPEPVSP